MLKSLKSYNLVLIVAIYLILAISYSVVTPIGRGADEWAHYWYARFIAENGRLPANITEREAAGYKSDWPPLYHLFAAGLTGWVETNGSPDFKYRSENIRRRLVPSMGPEAILHTEDELFSWRQEILVWHLGRFLSIAFSAGTLIVTYFIALDIFAVRRHAAAATVFLAFNPRFLFTGMLFNYDSLTLLISSLFLWVAVRIHKGQFQRWGFLVLGLLAGLALMTKYLAALLPVVIVYLLFSSNKRSTARFFRLATQSALAFIVAVGWWFAYLIITFNETARYGLILGTLAPLIRGDGSDRTVEVIFAWLSGGQAPPPAFIEKQSYSFWQVITELPVTFWGNPIIRPYPLNWFVLIMSLLMIAAAVGLVVMWRTEHHGSRRLVGLLLLYCTLPLPFMLIRLFGVRNILEAVQGRHILFLSAPAVAILFVWGLDSLFRMLYKQKNIGLRGSTTTVGFRASTQPTTVGFRTSTQPTTTVGFRASTQPTLFYVMTGLLLSGAVGQLLFMWQIYPPPLPVVTTAYEIQTRADIDITLPGGAKLVDYEVLPVSDALKIILIWQAGDKYAPEDYQMELSLVDAQNRSHSGWLSYQTEGAYPTRVWEMGDFIRDEGWLPLVGLPAGDYDIRLRLMGQEGEIVSWRTIASHTMLNEVRTNNKGWQSWRQGKILSRPPILLERETVQFTTNSNNNLLGCPPSPCLIGLDGISRPPIISGSGWANFVIEPDWAAGDYRLVGNDKTVLRVKENGRQFQIVAGIEHQYKTEANFDGQVKLLGYSLPNRRVQAGEGLPVILHWQGLRWMGESFVIFNRLLDNPQEGTPSVWGGRDRLAQENYSTLLWSPDEIVTDNFAVAVDPDTPDGIYKLLMGLYRQVNGEAQSLPILNPETGQPTDITSITTIPIKVGGSPPGVTMAEARPQNVTDFRFDNQIKLLGFDRSNSGVQLDITFYWQALQQVETDYTVFVHIRNKQGDTVAQKDAPPTNGVYPSSLWDKGEIIGDEIVVATNGLEAGNYDLVIGLYNPVTGVRLAVDGDKDGDGEILLQSFEVRK